MAPSRLDDPALLTETLQGWSAPDSLHSRLLTAGFDTVGKLAFSVSEGDTAAETAFIHSVLDPPGSAAPVSATLVSPSAACLRRLLHMARQSVSSTPPIPASLGLPAPSPSTSKLTATEVKDLKTAFASAYPGELLTADGTPSLDFLSQLRANLESGTSIWVPWRQRLSEAEFLSWQEHRKPRSDSQLFRALLAEDSDPPGPSVNINMGGPIEPPVRKALSLMASALALLQSCHLLVAKRFNDRFLQYALSRPSDSSLRPPSLSESCPQTGRSGQPLPV